MQGALVILLVMIVVGALLYITDVKYFRHHHTSSSDSHAESQDEKHSVNAVQEVGKEVKNTGKEEPEVCCGLHLVCEKTSLAVVSDEVIYYDDEELDRFRGRTPDSYTYSETEEFRDVLLTLLPQDIAGWARSITLRNIELPTEVKDELMLLISELRSNSSIAAV